ncbi:MAG: DoxX family protein [Betaproteobacteria bacterium]
MNNLEATLSGWSPRLLSVLRIITGFLFIPHGMQKLFGWPVPAGKGTVELFSLMGLAGVLEVVGGALLLLGLFTRPVAFVMSGFMATAYFMSHAPQSFWPLLNRGDAAVLYCFICLYLAAAGGGPWSLDSLMRDGSGRR